MISDIQLTLTVSAVKRVKLLHYFVIKDGHILIFYWIPDSDFLQLDVDVCQLRYVTKAKYSSLKRD